MIYFPEHPISVLFVFVPGMIGALVAMSLPIERFYLSIGIFVMSMVIVFILFFGFYIPEYNEYNDTVKDLINNASCDDLRESYTEFDIDTTYHQMMIERLAIECMSIKEVP